MKTLFLLILLYFELGETFFNTKQYDSGSHRSVMQQPIQ